MVDNAKAKREFPYILLVALRRIAAPLIAILTLHLSIWINGGELRVPYQALLIITVLITAMLFPGKSQHGNTLAPRISNIALSVVGRWFIVIAVLLLLGYATKTSSIFSRRVLFTWFILTPSIIVIAQVCIDYLLFRMLLSAGNVRKVIIVGANELGSRLATTLQSEQFAGMQLVGFFDDRGIERLPHDEPVNLLGKLSELPNFIRENNIDVIYITLPMRNIQRVSDLLDQLQDTTSSIYFVPDVFVFDLIQCRTSELGGLPIVSLCETPFHGTQGMIKAASDYLIASVVLILISPVMLAIAIGVKLTSPGSVIFKQRRYGLDGREIVVYKFRTMTVSEDSDNIRQATRNDDRITKFGAFLRRYSLDELPQFINVLQGTMSVVGPRPHAVAHNEEYRSVIKGYMMRHKVNPGITGLAQVLGYRGETESIEAMQNRVKYDLDYLRNWSLGLDLRIIFRTIRIMFRDDMAY
jgi:putative colanic acid biosynthesis UDP-glucose lipid carrier transferase